MTGPLTAAPGEKVQAPLEVQLDAAGRRLGHPDDGEHLTGVVVAVVDQDGHGHGRLRRRRCRVVDGERPPVGHGHQHDGDVRRPDGVRGGHGDREAPGGRRTALEGPGVRVDPRHAGRQGRRVHRVADRSPLGVGGDDRHQRGADRHGLRGVGGERREHGREVGRARGVDDEGHDGGVTQATAVLDRVAEGHGDRGHESGRCRVAADRSGARDGPRGRLGVRDDRHRPAARIAVVARGRRAWWCCRRRPCTGRRGRPAPRPARRR